MRCQDLTRELVSPTGALSPTQVAGHLAACPACRERSRRAARFDRIWEATRPPEPSMDALEALWASASAQLDALEAPATLRLARPARPRRRSMIGFVAAQAAAALLLLAPVAIHRDEARGETVRLDVRVGDDQLGVVRIGPKGKVATLEMQDLSRLYVSSSLPAHTPHDEVSEMEASTLDIVASAQ